MISLQLLLIFATERGAHGAPAAQGPRQHAGQPAGHQPHPQGALVLALLAALAAAVFLWAIWHQPHPQGAPAAACGPASAAR